MIRATHTLVVCAIASLAVANAQEFEIADVHPGTGLPPIHLPMLNSSMRGGQVRQGRYEVHSATIVDLIRTAYRVDGDKIIGGPAWMSADLFDVIAKAPADATSDSLRLMLQKLLANRFGLEIHPDTRPLPGLALLAGNRPQMKASTEGESGCRSATAVQIITVSCQSVTMADFANRLPQVAGPYLQGNPVADLTGMQGAWSFTFKMTARNWLTAAGSDGISLTDALEKQLGLRLESRDIPMPVLIVDQIARKPTANLPDVARRLPVLPTKFEVADIKPTAPEITQKSFRSQPGGLVELRGFTVAELIKMAWEIANLEAIDHEELLSGAPKWTERFDIVARAAGPERLDNDSVRLLLQALLAERFQLKSHVEKQTVTVDALTAVRPRLTKADPLSRAGCRNAPSPAGAMWIFTVVCRNTTMAQLVEDLPAFAGDYIPHPAIDATGLEGGWDFTIHWSPPHLVRAGEAAPANDPNGSLTMPEALEKELGLKLELRKHPMDVLVIDHVERMPTEN